MIPKTVHAVWLGGGKISAMTAMCINSWRRVLPDYNIKIWGERDLNLDSLANSNKFLRKCLKYHLWSFASDYLRLYVLYEYGGIYLDTDVEVLQTFNPLLKNNFFYGLEDNDFPCTGVLGAEPRSSAVKTLLDFYEDEIWEVDFFNNPIVFDHVIKNNRQIFESGTIFKKSVFSPYSPGSYLIENHDVVEKDDSITVHWYSANWNMNLRGYVFLNCKHIHSPIMKSFFIFKKAFGFLIHH